MTLKPMVIAVRRALAQIGYEWRLQNRRQLIQAKREKAR